MTIRCAVTYYDEEINSAGYLIGSDRLAIPINRKSNCIHVDKSFHGDRTVGFVAGNIPLRAQSIDYASDFSFQLSKLNFQFDEISEGKDYSNLNLFTQSSNLNLLIAKIEEGSIDLYSVSNRRETNNSTAKKLHSLEPEFYEEDQTGNLFWYSPKTTSFIVGGNSQRFSLDSARSFLEKLLTLDVDKDRETLELVGANLGEPNIYSVTFEGIRKVDL